MSDPALAAIHEVLTCPACTHILARPWSCRTCNATYCFECFGKDHRCKKCGSKKFTFNEALSKVLETTIIKSILKDGYQARPYRPLEIESEKSPQEKAPLARQPPQGKHNADSAAEGTSSKEKKRAEADAASEAPQKRKKSLQYAVSPFEFDSPDAARTLNALREAVSAKGKVVVVRARASASPVLAASPVLDEDSGSEQPAAARRGAREGKEAHVSPHGAWQDGSSDIGDDEAGEDAATPAHRGARKRMAPVNFNTSTEAEFRAAGWNTRASRVIRFVMQRQREAGAGRKSFKDFQDFLEDYKLAHGRKPSKMEDWVDLVEF